MGDVDPCMKRLKQPETGRGGVWRFGQIRRDCQKRPKQHVGGLSIPSPGTASGGRIGGDGCLL